MVHTLRRRILTPFLVMVSAVLAIMIPTGVAHAAPYTDWLLVTSVSQSVIYTQGIPGPYYANVAPGHYFGGQNTVSPSSYPYEDPSYFYTGAGWCVEYHFNNGSGWGPAQYAVGPVWTLVYPGDSYQGTWHVWAQSWKGCWSG